MKTPTRKPVPITHEFVEFIPNELEPGKLYVSIPYTTAAHACFCGCGTKVVTPISPIGWQLLFDGDTVSLRPSIGNWSFRCRSHYWITRNEVHWAGPMTQGAIERGRRRDRDAAGIYFGAADKEMQPPPAPPPTLAKKRRTLRDWLLRRS